MYWYVNVKPTAHSWDKSKLVIFFVYDVEYDLSKFCWKYFMYVHEGYHSIVFFSCNVLIWFCYQSTIGLVKDIMKLVSAIFWKTLCLDMYFGMVYIKYL